MPRVRQPRFQTRRRWTIADAQEALAAQHASGLSMSAFAKREGLDAQRLSRWRRRLASRPAGRRLAPRAAFIELVPRAPEPVEVVLRSGRILRVSTAVDAAALQRLVAALEQAEPC